MKINIVKSAESGKEVKVPRMGGSIAAAVQDGLQAIGKAGSDYNGYGYQTWTYTFTVSAATFRRVKKMLAEKAKKPPRVRKTEEETRAAWCARLAKLAGITVAEAEEIAAEKLEYKQEKIDEMEERQADRFSRKRASLIGRMERANPLRRIKDAGHAAAILAASDRHRHTGYDALLEAGRELAAAGEIDRGEVREWARAAV